MNSALNFIDEAFRAIPESDRAYKFRMKLVQEVTERANELTAAGIKDEKVIEDLIKSEHPDIAGEYNDSVLEEKKKKRIKSYIVLHVLAGVLIALVSAVLFLADLLILDNGKSWILLAGGFTALCIYYTSVVCSHYSHRRHILFHAVTRLLLAFTIMTIAALIFFISLFEFNIIHSWAIFPAGVICVLISDGVYAHFARKRLALFLYMAYIPISFAMLYIILSAAGITAWAWGWILIPVGIIVDLIVVIVRLAIDKKTANDTEDDSEWNAD